mgnify:FL=1
MFGFIRTKTARKMEEVARMLNCPCGPSRVSIDIHPAYSTVSKPIYYRRCTVCGRSGGVSSSRNVATLLWIQSTLTTVEIKELDWIF